MVGNKSDRMAPVLWAAAAVNVHNTQGGRKEGWPHLNNPRARSVAGYYNFSIRWSSATKIECTEIMTFYINIVVH